MNNPYFSQSIDNSTTFTFYDTHSIVKSGLTPFIISLLVISCVYLVTNKFAPFRKSHSQIHFNQDELFKPFTPTPITNFQWDKSEPLKSYPFKKGDYKLTMGIKNLDPQDWLLIEPTYLNRIENKVKIINNAHPDYPPEKDTRNSTLFVTPEVVPAIIEFYDIVMNYMCDKYPTCFKKDAHFFYNLITDKKYEISETDPIKLQEYMVENIEEDFIILLKDQTRVNEKDGSEYFFKGGVFAFAAGFDPRDRFDKPLSFIHHPVPNYETKLKLSMNRFFNRLKPGQFITRSNFSLQTHHKFYVDDSNKGYHLPKGQAQQALKFEELDFENQVHYRSERQVLTKLPKSKAIVFTIRTYLLPLSEVKKEGPELCDRFIGAFKGFPKEIAEYKRSEEWGPAVEQYLMS